MSEFPERVYTVEEVKTAKELIDKGYKHNLNVEGSPSFKEKKSVGIMPPDAKNEKIVGEIKKMNVLTPYAVSTRYGIRISAAKDFLEQLEANGVVQLVSGSHNLKIYKPAAS